jgi:pimeloyl-ACP methyl ester carboxylesterase
MTWTEKKFETVNGRRMAYVEMGDPAGDPIVFLHGNPTSSYLWRNVMPHMTDLGRCIAPDLIGMGDSEKLPDSGPDSYHFAEHADYLFKLLDQIGVHRKVTLVIHDWGSALGFHWANMHRDAVRGIAYIPLDGAPPDVTAIIADYAAWLEAAEVPKLFIDAAPGIILTGAQREYCRSWPNQSEVAVKGLHFIQEDSPNEIGQAIAGWLKAI